MAARAIAIDILSPAPVKKALKRARPSPLNDAVKRKLILKLDPSKRSTASSSPSSIMDMNMDSVEDQDLPEVTSIGTYVKVDTSTLSVVSCS